MVSQLMLALTVAAFMYLSATAAWANPRPVETYPAVDQDPQETPVDSGDAAEAPTPIADQISYPAAPQKIHVVTRKGKRGHPIKTPALSQAKAKHAKKPKASALAEKVGDEKLDFDVVPEEQVGAVIKRLKLCALILRDYGRAYDYRMHTVKDLEKILALLEGDQHGGSAPGPKPVPAIDDDPSEQPSPPAPPNERESS